MPVLQCKISVQFRQPSMAVGLFVCVTVLLLYLKRLERKGAVLRDSFVQSTLTVPVTLFPVLFSVLLRKIQCNKEIILLETVKEVRCYIARLCCVFNNIMHHGRWKLFADRRKDEEYMHIKRGPRSQRLQQAINLVGSCINLCKSKILHSSKSVKLVFLNSRDTLSLEV